MAPSVKFSVGLFLLLTLRAFAVHSQPGEKLRPLVLLDMTDRNGETSDANIASLKHLADVAGMPYIITDDVMVAIDYNIIIGGSEFISSSFDSDEVDALTTYVNDGGILVAPSVTDHDLFTLFGISNYSSSYSRYSLSWNMQSGDNSLRWFDDEYECTIKLGDSILYEDAVIRTLSYSRSTASRLAVYGDNSTAVVKNNAGQGVAYALGVAFKDVVMRGQLNHDFEAQRIYSNHFNPGTDVFMLFIKAIYAEYTPFATWKHTAPWHNRYVMMMTHDVDATPSMDTMHYYAEYEFQNQIRATYFVTTHYFADDLDADYYTPGVPKVAQVLSQYQTLASHSVGHFPDFANMTNIPPGGPGHTRATYHPHYSVAASATIGASTFGECEVSRSVLEEDLGVDIVSFRSGYLAFPVLLPDVLQALGYFYNSSYSAADVLTNFPYYERMGCSFTGETTNVLEIPITIDVDYEEDGMTPLNFYDKADMWLGEMEKTAANYGQVVCLIHPNRLYKVELMDYLYQNLPWGACKMELGAFGEYWETRNILDITSVVDNNNRITITVPNVMLMLNDKLSVVISNGQSLSGIEVKNEDGDPVAFYQSGWEFNDLIICFSVDPAAVSEYPRSSKTEYIRNYPNPFTSSTTLEYFLSGDTRVVLTVYDQRGREIARLADEEENAGLHQLNYQPADLLPGFYYYRLTTGQGNYAGKMVVVK